MGFGLLFLPLHKFHPFPANVPFLYPLFLEGTKIRSKWVKWSTLVALVLLSACLMFTDLC